MDDTMEAMLEVYKEIASPEELKFEGMAWRLPLPFVKEHIEAPFLEICGRLGVKAAFCMHDLVAAGRAKPVDIEAKTVKVIDVASEPVEDDGKARGKKRDGLAVLAASQSGA
jgi:hypothetical protein